MKRCKLCHTEQPLTQYYLNATRPDGYQDWCKTCTKEKESARRLKKNAAKEKTNNTTSVTVADQVAAGKMWKIPGGKNNERTNAAA